MKKSVLSFLLICAIKLNAQENKFNASSEVKKVTVFLTGAELNHEVKIKLKKGKNIVTFTGLSPRLDERSINLTPGSSEINVLYINSHTNYLDVKKDNEKIQNLKDSVEVYKDKLVELGVPAENMILETEAKSTGDNATLLRKYVEENNLNWKSFIIVCKPFMERRAFFRKVMHVFC